MAVGCKAYIIREILYEYLMGSTPISITLIKYDGKSFTKHNI